MMDDCWNEKHTHRRKLQKKQKKKETKRKKNGNNKVKNKMPSMKRENRVLVAIVINKRTAISINLYNNAQ